MPLVPWCIRYVAKEAGLFAQEGLDAEIIRTAGNVAPMALVANEVDFAIMFAFLAIPVRAKAGMSFLVDLTDLNVEYQGSTIATRRTFIQKYPNVTARLLHAIIRGVHFFNTRKEDTVRILAEFVGTNDRDALEKSWIYAAKMPAKPYAVESAVQAVINHLAEFDKRYAQRSRAEFIDSRPLSEIDRSGYIDRLYAGR